MRSTDWIYSADAKNLINKKKKIIKPKKTVYQDIHNHIYNNIIFLKFLYFLKYVITSD